MNDTNLIAAKLQSLGIIVRTVMEATPQTDGMIQLDGYHVQVGDTYTILVQEMPGPSPKFGFGKSCESDLDLFMEIAKVPALNTTVLLKKWVHRMQMQNAVIN